MHFLPINLNKQINPLSTFRHIQSGWVVTDAINMKKYKENCTFQTGHSHLQKSNLSCVDLMHLSLHNSILNTEMHIRLLDIRSVLEILVTVNQNILISNINCAVVMLTTWLKSTIGLYSSLQSAHLFSIMLYIICHLSLFKCLLFPIPYGTVNLAAKEAETAYALFGRFCLLCNQAG